MSDLESSITLSLISHTNAGKTTLARTLLRKEVGEVWDQPHVTDLSSAYDLIATGEGEALKIWDTPGFGDSARLLKRLRNSKNPIGWILTQVWDRFVDRALWCSQQAVRNVKEEAEIVLYLVNASERPEEAGYVNMEMEILTWIGKPVVLLLNQTGPPKNREEEKREEGRWRQHLDRFNVVRGVLTLDAFARCWVQEGVLLKTIAPLIRSRKRPVYQKLSDIWLKNNLAIFHQSLEALARHLAESLCDRERLDESSWSDRIRRILPFKSAPDVAQLSNKEQAMTLLAERLAKRIQGMMEELIQLHGLKGSAVEEISRRLTANYETNEPMHATLPSIFGSVISGALGGLAADMASGGLTFGGGTVVGTFLGFAGAAGLVKGYNLVRSKGNPCVRWSEEFCQGLVRSSILRYLAVAHFGRGRGDYTQSEHPVHWKNEVEQTVFARKARFQKIWESARAKSQPEDLERAVNNFLSDCVEELLSRFYPEAAGVFQAGP